MSLTPQALEDFERLWMEDHPDMPLSKDDLLAKATRVMSAVEAVWHPLPKMSGTSLMRP